MTPLPTNEPTPLPTLATVPSTPVPTYATIPLTYGTPVYPVYTLPSYVTPYQTPYAPYRQPGYTPSQYAVPEPSNPADIAFQHYSDSNFGIDYPATWKVSRTGNVQLTSASGRVSFTAEIGDFLPGLAGNYRLNPDISAVQNIVSREFPGYDPHNIISNYQSTTVRGVPATIYTVNIPRGSESYTRYILVTLHHAYWFTFAARSCDLQPGRTAQELYVQFAYYRRSGLITGTARDS